MARREPTVRSAMSRSTALALLAAFAAVLVATSIQPCRAQSAPSDSAAASPVAAPPPPMNPAASMPPAPTSAGSPLPLPRIGGYVQAREFYQENVGVTMLLNRVRFLITGTLPAKFSYNLLTEWQAVAGARLPSTVSLREAVIRWSPAPFTLTAGEFKTPFTREYLIPVPELEMADLAVAVDSIAPRYDVGVMGEYALGATATLAVGAFNGEGANTSSNRDSTVMLVGRFTLRPLAQLSLGASGTRDGDDSLRWGVDAQAQHRGIVLRAEYLTRHVRGRERGMDDFGWYLFEAFRIVPRVQLLSRQEDFQRPSRGISRRIRGLAYGANLDLAPNRLRLLLEMSRRVTGVQPLASDTYLAQIQARF